MPLSRTLNPQTNPAGYMATAGAVLAAVTMIYNAFQHHGLIDPAVIIGAVGAVSALLTRQIVTPTADPKNAAGVPLVPVPIVVTPHPMGDTAGPVHPVGDTGTTP